MGDYEIGEKVKGKKIKYASFSYDVTIEFTDGSRLKLEAVDSGPEWGHHASAHISSIFVKLWCSKGCGPTELVTGDVIYPDKPALAEKKFWRCPRCQAYVGCHPGTEKPLGSTANAELRQARMAAHDVFDQLWKSNELTKRDAYIWLRVSMFLSEDECHISMFDLEQCQTVVRLCKERRERAREG